MRQFKYFVFVFVILFSMLACSLGRNTDKVEDLKSTIESLKSTIEPQIESQIETVVPNIPDLPGQPATIGPGVNELKLLGQHGGSSGAIAVDAGIAYIGQGPRVLAVDVSKADAPRVLGETGVLPGLVEGIGLDGKTIFAVTKYGGMYSFDFKDPANPGSLGEFIPDTPGCDAIEILDGYAYLACNAGGLHIVDISDPQSMKEVGQGAEHGARTSIKVVGDYAYIIDISAHGLAAYDVSDRANPRRTGLFSVNDVTGDYPEMYSFASVKQCGKLLCLAGGQSGLVTLKLDDPAKPVFAGRYDTGYASGLVQIDNMIYLVDDIEGVHVLDISNPSKIKQVGMMPTSVGGWELSVTELYERPTASHAGRLYIADQAFGVTIIDVADPGNLKRIGHYMNPAPETLFDITVLNNFAYIIGRDCGFRVLDVADPSQIKEVAFDDSRKNLNSQVPSGLVVEGNHAYISDSNYPFHIYDISTPSKPDQVGAVFDHAASSGAFDIAIAGKYAYLSGWGLQDAMYPGNGIWVIDISKPNDPKAVNFVDLPNEHWSLAIKGTVLYALDGNVDDKQKDDLSLRVLDISDPQNPVVIDKIPVPMMPLMPSDMVVAGDRLYISLSSLGILGFDISDPLKPVQLGNLPGATFTASPNLDWFDPYLIQGGMIVYDLTKANDPVMAGMAYLPGAWTADSVGDKLYVVTQFQGLYIYQLE